MRQIRQIIVLLVIAAGALALAQTQAQVEKLMQDAADLAGRDENEAALKKFDELIAIAERARAKPEDLVSIYEAAAFVASRIPSPEAARKAVSLVDKASPILKRMGQTERLAALTNLRAYQALAAGDLKESQKSFDQTAQLRPDLAQANAMARAAASGDPVALQNAFKDQQTQMAQYGMGSAGAWITAELMISNGKIPEARSQILKMETDMFAKMVMTSMAAGAEALGMPDGTGARAISLGVMGDLLFYQSDAEVRQNALQLLLSFKNSDFDTGRRVMQNLRRNPSPQATSLRQQLTAQYTRIGQLWGEAALSGAPVAAATLKPLLDQAASAESEALNLEFANSLGSEKTPRVKAVAAALPKDAALAEFARVDWFDYRKMNPKATYEERKAMKFAQHYVAYVLLADGTIHSQDLGDAAPIDALVKELVSRMDAKLPAADLRRAGQKLYSLLWKPLQAALGSRTRILISPDSQLALLAFDLLVNDQGQYLVETHSVSYLFSGAQLAQPAVEREAQLPAAVLAAPDFVKSGGTERAQSLHQRFATLPYTLQEAQAIQRIVPQAKLFTGAQASEASLKTLPPARIIHLATHGYYVEVDTPRPANMGFIAGTWAPYRSMRSGLVWREAGRGAVGEDGLLTAIEISALDLSATKLVVLSACNSGVGDALIGGSVSGLRNAFQVAGAQALVSSLWKVDDAAGKELMESFYGYLADGKPISAALRQSKLDMLKTARAHPYFWASFAFEGRDQTLRF